VRDILNHIDKPSGEDTLYEKIMSSYERKEYGDCILHCTDYIKQQTEGGKEKYTEACRILGECYMESGDAGKAMPAFMKAYNTAKKSGVYFTQPQKFNRLVEHVAHVYRMQGSGEMADAFLNYKK
jgi:hypothetical protein